MTRTTGGLGLGSAADVEPTPASPRNGVSPAETPTLGSPMIGTSSRTGRTACATIRVGEKLGTRNDSRLWMLRVLRAARWMGCTGYKLCSSRTNFGGGDPELSSGQNTKPRTI